MTLKQFEFSTEEDFIQYLKELILLIHKNLNAYNEQIKKLELFIEEHKLIERPERAILPYVYEDFRGRLFFFIKLPFECFW